MAAAETVVEPESVRTAVEQLRHPGAEYAYLAAGVSGSGRNYGFNLSWRDRLFGTYREQPAKGHVGMSIGQSDWRDARDCVALWGMLRIPFHDPR